MELSDAVRLECCDNDFKARNKDDALLKIAELFGKVDIFKEIDHKIIYEALKKREEMGSTGFGNGIAIPHCQLSEIDDFVVSVLVSRKGISFDALDKKKVKIFVTIVGPTTSRSGHLKLLAQISKILKDTRVHERLIKSGSKINLYEEFLRHASPEIATTRKKEEEKLMLLVVKDDSIMEDITEIFIEYGIEESVIFETQQMANLLSKVPLFMGFFNFTGDKNPYSKVVLLKIDKNYVDAIIKGLEDTFGDLDNFSSLSIMVLDLYFTKG